MAGPVRTKAAMAVTIEKNVRHNRKDILGFNLLETNSPNLLPGIVQSKTIRY